MLQSRFNFKFRFIALSIVFAFASQEIAQAAPSGAATLFSAAMPMPRINFRLPDSVAVIEDGWTAPAASKKTARTIILIQDAHTNDSAQMNLAYALHTILPAEGIKYVFTEAAQGDVSLSYLKPQFPRPALEEAARQFVRKGLIKGSEYLNVSSDDDFVIWGVEDKKLYDDSVLAYQAEADSRKKALSFISRAQAAIEELKPENTSEAYLKLDRLQADYLQNKITITAYLDGLKEAMGDKNLRTGLESLDKLDILRVREAKLDLTKISQQQEEAVRSLSAADQTELGSDKGQSVSPFAFKPGAADRNPSGFYTLLEEKLNGAKVPADQYPDLFNYFNYLKSAKKLDAVRALKELGTFEAAAFDRVSATREEKWFTLLTKNLRAWRSMLELTMMPEEYERYRSEKDLFDIDVICGFVNGLISKSKRHYDRILAAAGETDEARIAAEKFYELTFSRDAAFMERLVSKMDAAQIQKAVLITGGYHSTNLKALLRQKGFSYVSIIPQVTHETDHDRYERLLLKQVASIQKERTALAKAETSTGFDTSAHAAMTEYAVATGEAAHLVTAAARMAGANDPFWKSDERKRYDRNVREAQDRESRQRRDNRERDTKRSDTSEEGKRRYREEYGDNGARMADDGRLAKAPPAAVKDDPSSRKSGYFKVGDLVLVDLRSLAGGKLPALAKRSIVAKENPRNTNYALAVVTGVGLGRDQNGGFRVVFLAKNGTLDAFTDGTLRAEQPVLDASQNNVWKFIPEMFGGENFHLDADAAKIPSGLALKVAIGQQLIRAGVINDPGMVKSKLSIIDTLIAKPDPASPISLPLAIEELAVMDHFRGISVPRLLWVAKNRKLDTSVRAAAIRALARIGLRTDKVVPVLIPLMNNIDKKIRDAAKESVSNFRSAALPHLIAALNTAGHDKAQRIVDVLPDTVNKDALRGALHNAKDKARLALFRVLKAHDPSPEAIRAILPSVLHKKSSVRRAAYDAMMSIAASMIRKLTGARMATQFTTRSGPSPWSFWSRDYFLKRRLSLRISTAGQILSGAREQLTESAPRRSLLRAMDKVDFAGDEIPFWGRGYDALVARLAEAMLRVDWLMRRTDWSGGAIAPARLQLREAMTALLDLRYAPADLKNFSVWGDFGLDYLYLFVAFKSPESPIFRFRIWPEASRMEIEDPVIVTDLSTIPTEVLKQLDLTDRPMAGARMAEGSAKPKAPKTLKEAWASVRSAMGGFVFSGARYKEFRDNGTDLRILEKEQSPPLTHRQIQYLADAVHKVAVEVFAYYAQIPRSHRDDLDKAIRRYIGSSHPPIKYGSEDGDPQEIVKQIGLIAGALPTLKQDIAHELKANLAAIHDIKKTLTQLRRGADKNEDLDLRCKALEKLILQVEELTRTGRVTDPALASELSEKGISVFRASSSMVRDHDSYVAKAITAMVPDNFKAPASIGDIAFTLEAVRFDLKAVQGVLDQNLLLMRGGQEDQPSALSVWKDLGPYIESKHYPRNEETNKSVAYLKRLLALKSPSRQNVLEAAVLIHKLAFFGFGQYIPKPTENAVSIAVRLNSEVASGTKIRMREHFSAVEFVLDPGANRPRVVKGIIKEAELITKALLRQGNADKAVLGARMAWDPNDIETAAIRADSKAPRRASSAEHRGDELKKFLVRALHVIHASKETPGSEWGVFFKKVEGQNALREEMRGILADFYIEHQRTVNVAFAWNNSVTPAFRFPEDPDFLELAIAAVERGRKILDQDTTSWENASFTVLEQPILVDKHTALIWVNKESGDAVPGYKGAGPSARHAYRETPAAADPREVVAGTTGTGARLATVRQLWARVQKAAPQGTKFDPENLRDLNRLLAKKHLSEPQVRHAASIVHAFAIKVASESAADHPAELINRLTVLLRTALGSTYLSPATENSFKDSESQIREILSLIPTIKREDELDLMLARAFVLSANELLVRLLQAIPYSLHIKPHSRQEFEAIYAKLEAKKMTSSDAVEAYEALYAFAYGVLGFYASAYDELAIQSLISKLTSMSGAKMLIPSNQFTADRKVGPAGLSGNEAEMIRALTETCVRLVEQNRKVIGFRARGNSSRPTVWSVWKQLKPLYLEHEIAINATAPMDSLARSQSPANGHVRQAAEALDWIAFKTFGQYAGTGNKADDELWPLITRLNGDKRSTARIAGEAPQSRIAEADYVLKAIRAQIQQNQKHMGARMAAREKRAVKGGLWDRIDRLEKAIDTLNEDPEFTQAFEILMGPDGLNISDREQHMYVFLGFLFMQDNQRPTGSTDSGGRGFVSKLLDPKGILAQKTKAAFKRSGLKWSSGNKGFAESYAHEMPKVRERINKMGPKVRTEQEAQMDSQRLTRARMDGSRQQAWAYKKGTNALLGTSTTQELVKKFMHRQLQVYMTSPDPSAIEAAKAVIRNGTVARAIEKLRTRARWLQEDIAGGGHAVVIETIGSADTKTAAIERMVASAGFNPYHIGDLGRLSQLVGKIERNQRFMAEVRAWSKEESAAVSNKELILRDQRSRTDLGAGNLMDQLTARAQLELLRRNARFLGSYSKGLDLNLPTGARMAGAESTTTGFERIQAQGVKDLVAKGYSPGFSERLIGEVVRMCESYVFHNASDRADALGLVIAKIHKPGLFASIGRFLARREVEYLRDPDIIVVSSLVTARDLRIGAQLATQDFLKRHYPKKVIYYKQAHQILEAAILSAQSRLWIKNKPIIAAWVQDKPITIYPENKREYTRLWLNNSWDGHHYVLLDDMLHIMIAKEFSRKSGQTSYLSGQIIHDSVLENILVPSDFNDPTWNINHLKKIVEAVNFGARMAEAGVRAVDGNVDRARYWNYLTTDPDMTPLRIAKSIAGLENIQIGDILSIMATNPDEGPKSSSALYIVDSTLRLPKGALITATFSESARIQILANRAADERLFAKELWEKFRILMQDLDPMERWDMVAKKAGEDAESASFARHMSEIMYTTALKRLAQHHGILPSTSHENREGLSLATRLLRDADATVPELTAVDFMAPMEKRLALVQSLLRAMELRMVLDMDPQQLKKTLLTMALKSDLSGANRVLRDWLTFDHHSLDALVRELGLRTNRPWILPGDLVIGGPHKSHADRVDKKILRVGFARLPRFFGNDVRVLDPDGGSGSIYTKGVNTVIVLGRLVELRGQIDRLLHPERLNSGARMAEADRSARAPEAAVKGRPVVRKSNYFKVGDIVLFDLKSMPNWRDGDSARGYLAATDNPRGTLYVLAVVTAAGFGRDKNNFRVDFLEPDGSLATLKSGRLVAASVGGDVQQSNIWKLDLQKYGPKHLVLKKGPASTMTGQSLQNNIHGQLITGGIISDPAMVRGKIVAVEAWVHAYFLNGKEDVRLTAREKIDELAVMDKRTGISVPYLIETAERTELGSQIRRAAVKAIAYIGRFPRESVPALIGLMSDPDKKVRIAAREAVSDFRSRAFPHLITALKDSDPALTARIVSVLPDTVNREELMSGLKNADPKVLLALMRVIRNNDHSFDAIRAVLAAAQHTRNSSVKKDALKTIAVVATEALRRLFGARMAGGEFEDTTVLSPEHLNAIANAVQHSILPDTDAPRALDPIPSDLPIPTAERIRGRLAISQDAGGTNFRVGYVGYDADGTKKIYDSGPIPFRPEDKKSGAAFFDRLADGVVSVLKKLKMQNEPLTGGLTFSFPHANGIILKSADKVKGFRFNDVAEQNVLTIINDRLRDQGVAFRFNAVTNDTLTTLVAAIMQDPNTDVAVINGTGYNVGVRFRGKLLNLEAGGLKLTDIDGLPLKSVDKKFMKRGAEELIAGGFLGPLAARVIADKIRRGVMMKGLAVTGPLRFIKWLTPHYWRVERPFMRLFMMEEFLTTAVVEKFAARGHEAGFIRDRFDDFMTEMVQRDDTPGLMKAESLSLFAKEYFKDDDVIQIRRVSRVIFDRSADIVAAMIAGALTAADRTRDGRVAVDGSMWKDDAYLTRVEKTLRSMDQFRGRDTTVSIVYKKMDASGEGSALQSMMVAATTAEAGSTETGVGARMASRRTESAPKGAVMDVPAMRPEARFGPGTLVLFDMNGLRGNVKENDRLLTVRQNPAGTRYVLGFITKVYPDPTAPASELNHFLADITIVFNDGSFGKGSAEVTTSITSNRLWQLEDRLYSREIDLQHMSTDLSQNSQALSQRIRKYLLDNGFLEDKERIRLLIDKVRASSDPDAVRSAINRLAKIDHFNAESASLLLAKAQAENQDARIRTAAIRAITIIHPQYGPLLPVLMELFADTDDSVRAAAVKAVKDKYEYSLVEPYLKTALRNKNRDRYLMVVEAVFNVYAHFNILDRITPWLKNDQPRIRLAAVRALDAGIANQPSFNNKKILTRLLSVMSGDRIRSVREAAHDVLRSHFAKMNGARMALQSGSGNLDKARYWNYSVNLDGQTPLKVIRQVAELEGILAEGILSLTATAEGEGPSSTGAYLKTDDKTVFPAQTLITVTFSDNAIARIQKNRGMFTGARMAEPAVPAATTEKPRLVRITSLEALEANDEASAGEWLILAYLAAQRAHGGQVHLPLLLVPRADESERLFAADASLAGDELSVVSDSGTKVFDNARHEFEYLQPDHIDYSPEQRVALRADILSLNGQSQRQDDLAAFDQTIKSDARLRDHVADVPLDIVRDLGDVSAALIGKAHDGLFAEYVKDVVASFMWVRGHAQSARLFLPQQRISRERQAIISRILGSYGLMEAGSPVFLESTTRAAAAANGRVLMSIYTRDGDQRLGHINFRQATPAEFKVPAETLVSSVTAALNFIAGKPGALDALASASHERMDHLLEAVLSELPLDQNRAEAINGRIYGNRSAVNLDMKIRGEEMFLANETLKTLMFRIDQAYQAIRMMRAAVESAA